MNTYKLSLALGLDSRGFGKFIEVRGGRYSGFSVWALAGLARTYIGKSTGSADTVLRNHCGDLLIAGRLKNGQRCKWYIRSTEVGYKLGCPTSNEGANGVR